MTKLKEFYIDSNVIISSQLKDEKTHKESKKFIDFVLQNKNKKIKFYTSVFTYLELASAIMRRTKNADKAYSLLYRVSKPWKKSLSPLLPAQKDKLSFQGLIDELIEETLVYRTPTADTIHAHTAFVYEMDYFVTWNVKDFSNFGKKSKSVKIITPTDAMNHFTKGNFSLEKAIVRPHIGTKHYKQKDFYPLITKVLEEIHEPLRRQDIVDRIKTIAYDTFSDADKKVLKNGNERWENTLRWAVSRMAMEKKILSVGRNQWQLSD